MKILSPIASAEEVAFLAANGAEEFYCGVVPSEWTERYSNAVWLNRRNSRPGNLPSLQALKELVRQAESVNVPVFLTLNSPYYTADQYPILLDLARAATEEIGVSALIVQDVGLISTLKQHLPDAVIHISSLGVALNSVTVNFYADLGAQRVILPRSVRLSDVAAIRRAVDPSVELEVFILNDGCVWEEGYCLTTHQAVGAFCAEPWQYQRVSGSAETRGEMSDFLKAHLADYDKWRYYVQSCGCTAMAGGLPPGPCGLCALPELAAMGIDSIKIVGREASPYRKIGSLQLVKAVMDQVRSGEGQQAVQAYAKEIRRSPEACASGYMCYYR